MEKNKQTGKKRNKKLLNTVMKFQVMYFKMKMMIKLDNSPLIINLSTLFQIEWLQFLKKIAENLQKMMNKNRKKKKTYK